MNIPRLNEPHDVGDVKMNSVMLKGAFLGLLGATALLVGCGGGGGGGGGSSFSFNDIFDEGGPSPSVLFNAEAAPPLPGTPSTAVTITPTNQNEVVGATEGGIDGSIVVGAMSVLGARSANVSSDDSFSAFTFAEDTLFKYLGAIGAAQNTAAKTVMSASGACDYSGSITIALDVANPNGGSIEAGDSLTMSFNNCTDVFGGSTTDGAMMITLSAGSLDFNAADFSSNISLTFSFNNLSSTYVGQTNVVHGGFTLSTDGTNNSLTATSLYVMNGSGESALLTNYNVSGISSGTGFDEIETLTISLTLASTTINGVINIVTDPTDPLVQGDFDDRARSGTLIITSGTSTLTVEVLSTTQVRLSLDSDGVGGIDAGYPVDVSWTDIDAAGGGISIDLNGDSGGAVSGTDVHGDSIATATAVALPSTTSGQINFSGDEDFFRIEVTGTGLLTVSTSGSTDTFGYLYNSGGAQLASNDDGGTVWNFNIPYSVTPGIYYVRVRHFSSGTGLYSLVTEFSP